MANKIKGTDIKKVDAIFKKIAQTFIDKPYLAGNGKIFNVHRDLKPIYKAILEDDFSPEMFAKLKQINNKLLQELISAGIKHLVTLQEMRRVKDECHDKRIELAREKAKEIRRMSTETFTQTKFLKRLHYQTKIAGSTIAESTLRKWYKDGSLPLPLKPNH